MPISNLYQQDALLKSFHMASNRAGDIYHWQFLTNKKTATKNLIYNMEKFLIIISSIFLIAVIGQIPGIVKTVNELKQPDLSRARAIHLETELSNRLLIIVLLAVIAGIFYHPINS